MRSCNFNDLLLFLKLHFYEYKKFVQIELGGSNIFKTGQHKANRAKTLATIPV
jgi:hypothetical protein